MIKEIEELDLGRFEESINKKFLILNDDGTYDYHGDLYLSKLNLKSLGEIPIRFRKVNGYFQCSKNQLTSLQYAPSYVAGSFYCRYNKLISLQYTPSFIGYHSNCEFNFLLSTAYKSKIDGNLNFGKNPFSITDDVIKAIKEMTIDQRVAELKFFEENDKNAYEMMLQILEENDIGI